MEPPLEYMDYLMDAVKPAKLCLNLHPPRRSAALAINGLGIREEMPAKIVNRPGGTRDFLFMQFHDPVEIQVDGAMRACAPETFILWEPSAPHHYGSTRARWSHSWLHCDGASIEAAVHASGVPLDRPIALADTSIIDAALVPLYAELSGNRQPDRIITENLVQIWIRRLRRAAAADAAPAVPSRILAAQAFLERAFSEEVKLERLASFAGLSVSHLSAEFRRHLGVPPMRYLLELRLRRAAYLLADVNLSVSEVARESGFSDPLYFSRQFRRRFGQSPRKYRRR
jgi:AraC family transcriptional regulator of arabinose operon